MKSRREFLKESALLTTGAFLATGKTAFAGGSSLPLGVIYTRENPGKWAKKVGSHAPKVRVEDGKVTIQTVHPMTEKHYIVRHTLVTTDGKVIGAKTFYPSDKRAESSYQVEAEGGSKFYATSFCNIHDFWVTAFTI